MSMLLSMTLLGIAMMHPLGASVMNGFCTAVADEGYRAEASTSSLEMGMSAPCAVASRCIASNVVHPSSAPPTILLAVVSMPYSWVTPAFSGLDVAPELGPPKRVA